MKLLARIEEILALFVFGFLSLIYLNFRRVRPLPQGTTEGSK